MTHKMNRRQMLQDSAIAGLTISAAQVQSRDIPAIRAGFVGVGARGTALIKALLRLRNVKVLALGDVNESNLQRAAALVRESGRPEPTSYSRNEEDWQRLCKRDDLDLIVTATPGRWHTPICVAAMKAGKHAATEPPAAQTVEECWELVETSEKTGKHCALLQSTCYGRDAMMVLNMIRGGLLGDPLYAEAGYMRDLRAATSNQNGEASIHGSGNLYATHPLGPVSWWMGINRGDQFTHLMSMSSAAGGINSTLIYTAGQRIINLYCDTHTPRPQEGLVRVQCTKGVYHFLMGKIFVDGRSNGLISGNRWRLQPEWEDPAHYRAEYEAPLWKEAGAEQARASNGQDVDYIVLDRLIKNLQTGNPLDIDVYDAAAWSAIIPLSETSVKGRSAPADIPDFTRGKWKARPFIDPAVIV